MRQTFLLMLLLVGATPVFAKEDALQRDIREFHIVHVADGPIGHWGDAERGGEIKYLIYKGGHEESYNSLFIQWSETKPGDHVKKPVVTNRFVNLVLGVFDTPKI